MALALCMAAVIVAGIRLAMSRGEDMTAWAVVCVAVSLLWGRF